MLGGNQLVDAQLPITFRAPAPRTPVCASTLTSADATALARAVRRHYHWEWFVDDLPVAGFVGPAAEDGEGTAIDAAAAADVAVYTHRAFRFTVNGDRIIHVNVTPGAPVRVEEGARVELTYSVEWEDTDVPFNRRFETYLDASFFEHQIHW